MPVTLTETEEYTLAVQGPAAGDPRTAASVRQMGTPLANRSKWLLRRLEQLLGQFAPLGGVPTPIASVDPTTDVFTLEGHGLADNDYVRIAATNGSTIPTPLLDYSGYFVIVVDADHFKLAVSSGPGPALNITGSGSGVFYVAKITADVINQIHWPQIGAFPRGNLFALLNYLYIWPTAFLASQTASSGGSRLVGAEALSRAVWNFAAGTLYAKLVELADKAAKLDAATTTFTGKFRVGASAAAPSADGDAAIEHDLTVGNLLAVTGSAAIGNDVAINGSLAVDETVTAGQGVTVGDGATQAVLNLKSFAKFARECAHIAPTDTTKTCTASASLWFADQWHDASNLLTITLADYAGSENPEMDILFLPTGASDQIAFKRSTGGVIVTITGPALTRWRWEQSPTVGSPRWRYMGPGSLHCDPAKTSVSALLI